MASNVPAPAPIPRLVPSTEAARILGIASQSLRMMRYRDLGPAYLKMGNGQRARAFYREDELLKWIESRPRYTGTTEERAALAQKAAAR